MRVVIADAGPLIALARLQQLELLARLFRTVWITDVVAAELGMAGPTTSAEAFPGIEALRDATQQGWLHVVETHSAGDDPYQPINPGVDAGEASAFGLAFQEQRQGRQVLVVIDDRCGRAEARRQGLSIIGTAAVLVLAKEQQLIPACAPLLHNLRQQGYYLSDHVIAAVLHQAGEA